METCWKSTLLANFMFFLILSNICNADDAPVPPQMQNPTEIVGKALECFGHVYACPPEHRLTPSGTLNVHYEETDEYCNGGCFDETQVVLTCVDQILSNFQFYNKATIDDIRNTIVQACSHSEKRGDFDVTERIHASSKATNLRPKYILGTAIIFVSVWGLLLPLIVVN